MADIQDREAMDALDDHLDRIHAATDRDWHELLSHFNLQCEPSKPAELRPIRTGRVPDGAWEGSAQYHALADMLGRCWPSERSQRQ